MIFDGESDRERERDWKEYGSWLDVPFDAFHQIHFGKMVPGYHGDLFDLMNQVQVFLSISIEDK